MNSAFTLTMHFLLKNQIPGCTQATNHIQIAFEFYALSRLCLIDMLQYSNSPTFVHACSPLKIYSASMKSYQYRNFDILENIKYSSSATVTFILLVNDKLVWRDKTVICALELWCT